MFSRIQQLRTRTGSLVRAFHLGLRDGLEQGVINTGMSYTCAQHQCCWDWGANLGEWLYQNNTCMPNIVRRAIRP